MHGWEGGLRRVQRSFDPHSRNSRGREFRWSAGETRELSRELGLLEAMTIGLGAIVSGGIYSTLGILMDTAGPAVILSALVCTLASIAVGYSYVKLGRKFPSSGASYEYAAQAFKKYDFVKVILGYALWFGYVVSLGFYSLGFGLYANYLIPFIPARLFGLAIILALLSVNLLGVGLTGHTQDILVLLEVGILASFAILGAAFIRPENYTAFFSRGYVSVFTASALMLIGYEGFEVIASAGEEIKDPEKNLGRAIYLAILIASAVYSAVILVAVGVSSGHIGGAPLAELANLVAGVPGMILLGFGALFSFFSDVNAVLFSSSRLAYAMARDKMMPGILSKIGRKRKVPSVSLIITSLLGFFFMLIDVRELSSLASLIFFFVFFTISLSNLKLRAETGSNAIFPIIAMLLCGYVALFADVTAWIGLGLLLLGAFALHLSSTRLAKIFRSFRTIDNR
ncbi:MAG: APC family permease [Nitrososphaeria archaeon]